MIRRFLIVLLVLAMAVPVVACGRKSAPEHPPGAEYPRKFPTR